MKRLCYLLSGAIAAILIAAMASPIPANALDFTLEVVSLAEYSSPSFSLDGKTYKTGLTDLPSSYVGAVYVNTGSSYSLRKGDFVQLNTTIVSNGVCNSTDVVDLGGSSSAYPLMDMKIVGQQSYNGTYCATVVNTIYRSANNTNISIYTFPLFLQNNAGSKFHQFRVNSVSFFRYNGSSAANLAPVLEYINNFHVQTSKQLSILYDEVHNYRTETNNNLQTVISSLNNISLSTSGLNTSINNAADQAHKDSAAQLAAQQKANEIAEEQKNFVTDTSTPEAGDIANADSLPSVGLLPAGPLDSILLLPVNILNSIIQSFGGNCQPIVAPLPFVDQDMTFPCMTDTLYTGALAPVGVFIGGVASAFILYGYFKHLYKKVDRAVSLETTDEDEWGIL